VYRDYVRVLEPGRELNFAPEALDVYCGGKVGREYLDDDFSPE
jgi:hypothetical protein